MHGATLHRCRLPSAGSLLSLSLYAHAGCPADNDFYLLLASPGVVLGHINAFLKPRRNASRLLRPFTSLPHARWRRLQVSRGSQNGKTAEPFKKTNTGKKNAERSEALGRTTLEQLIEKQMRCQMCRKWKEPGSLAAIRLYSHQFTDGPQNENVLEFNKYPVGYI